MRCEDVQLQLAGDVTAPASREAVESHVRRCPICQDVSVLFSRMDEVLKRGPVWHPPQGFASRIAALGAAVLDVADDRQLRSEGVLQAAALGLIVSATGLLAGRLLEPVALETGRLLAHRTTAAAAQLVEWIAGHGSETLAANALPLAWTCAALSLCTAAWFTRRALA